MNFILYSQINEKTIGQSLGMPEYSYYFLMREYEHILKAIGSVHYVKYPKLEVDSIFDDCVMRGEDCVFLSFSPPNKTEIDLRCPTISVFAWEFSTIPNEVWDNEPRNDWRTVFSAHGRTITLAHYTADVVRQEMGDDFPVLVWPIPIWERLQHIKTDGLAIKAGRQIPVSGLLIDSHATPFDVDGLEAAAAQVANDAASNEPDYQVIPAAHKSFFTAIGQAVGDSIVTLDGHAGGFLLYGPYSSLDKGRYRITISGRLSVVNAGAYVDVVCSKGGHLLAYHDISQRNNARTASMELVSFEIEVPERVEDLEIRVWVPEQTVGELYAVQIESIKPTEVLASSMLFTNLGESFHTQIGEKQAGTIVVSGKHSAGYLLFGPYCQLKRGSYEVTINGHFASLAAGAWIDVVCQKAQTTLARYDIPCQDADVEPPHILAVLGFDLVDDIADLEIRVYVPANTVGVLTSVEITQTGQSVVHANLNTDALLSVSGVVYTAVLNPLEDRRKNWHDILSAFVWTFREVKDAVLVFKFTYRDFGAYQTELLAALSRLAPYQCRVVCIHDYLNDDAYADLIRATTYYVNASAAEGLCIPLIEFLTCGVPAIAPQHTAMLDYIDDAVAFTFDAQSVPASWPQDRRHKNNTKAYRTDWTSLCAAYIRSYEVAKNNPEAYQLMSQSATERMRDYAGNQNATQNLVDFLSRTKNATV